MDELLDTMEFHSDDDSLKRVIRDAEQYLIDFAPSETDYDRTWELRSQVMQAFLEFVRYHHDGAISSCKKHLLFTDDDTTPIKKDSAKPMGVTTDLEDYPSKACVILDEVLSCVDEQAKMDDLDKIKSRIHHSMQY
ncbi:hypothetical protein AWC38_SpisGene10315 [Stylophora pistillata]|uniref:Uncharacterized protein n=1 Tax=Stylophora pistillata TaxID=50429 RepID=A0A2B4S7K5_STYPI|nr:hypothetical protein AWC38_SpisGene10315 [Stylophora pistillata]